MKKVDSLIAGIIRGFHIYNDAILGIFLVAASVYLFASSFTIKIMKPPVAPVDTARFFPQLVFGALILLGVVLAVRGFLKAKSLRESAPAGEALDAKVLAFKRSIIALLMIGVFILGMEPVGYIPMAILYMVASMFYMSEKAGWKPVAYGITAVAVAVACYFLFRKFVYVRLPAGILKGVLG